MAQRIAIIDFETTGMSPAHGARAAEVGIVLIEGGRIVDRYQSLMNTGQRMPWSITQLTGITNAMLQDAPAADTVMREAAAFVGDAPMVAHNASFDSKFWAAYHIARLATFDEHSSLTLVSGRFAQRAGAQTALISAVNAGIEGLARGLASELSPVRVNVLSPGFVDTGMHPEALVEKMRQRSQALPVKRIALPEDIASAALLLATNSMISGTVLAVDGGDTVTLT